VVESQRLKNFPNHDILSKASFRALPCAALKASVVDAESRLFIIFGKAFPLSLISFHVAQSNNTTLLFVELAGHTTSHAHSQS
jgi:hypothetical protein